MAFPSPPGSLDGWPEGGSDDDGASMVSGMSGNGFPSVSGSVSTVSGATYVPPHARKMNKIAQLKLDLEELELKNKIVEATKEASKHAGPTMPRQDLPFFLKPEPMAYLRETFPRTTFRCTEDNAHDHPLGHTETMIGVAKALRLAQAGSVLVDLFGKPKVADKFRRSQARSTNPKTMFSYVAIKTEKDCVRSLEYGDAVDTNGTLRYYMGTGDPTADFVITDEFVELDGKRIMGKDLVWFCSQTMYYLTDLQIATLLKPKGSRMIATIHRHPNDNGEMFLGEMTYSKMFGMVEQINSATGERYIHRDLSYLWDSKSKVVRSGGLAYAWTFHMVSKFTWNIVLTGVPINLDERFDAISKQHGPAHAAHEMNVHDLVPTKFEHPCLKFMPRASCTMVGGIPVLSYDGTSMPPFKLTCPELFEYLCLQMVGKPRDPDRFHDLMSLARSHVTGSAGFPGKKDFKVSSHDLFAHVANAWVSGLESEVEFLRAIESYGVAAREHKGLLNGRAVAGGVGLGREGLLRSTLNAARYVNHARRGGDLITATLDVLD